mgnify:CR=1 FL=1
MYKPSQIQKQELFGRIKIISNPKRFHILELTEAEQISITELSSKLKLAYTKCADYISMMEKKGLIQKMKVGKEVKVKSMVKLSHDKIEFRIRTIKE